MTGTRSFSSSITSISSQKPITFSILVLRRAMPAAKLSLRGPWKSLLNTKKAEPLRLSARSSMSGGNVTGDGSNVSADRGRRVRVGEKRADVKLRHDSDLIESVVYLFPRIFG